MNARRLLVRAFVLLAALINGEINAWFSKNKCEMVITMQCYDSASPGTPTLPFIFLLDFSSSPSSLPALHEAWLVCAWEAARSPC